MTLEDLERRIKALEDIEEIKKLKARYCAYCDDSYDADGIAALFTEDAIWDGGMRGRAEGREGIRDFFRRSSQRLPLCHSHGDEPYRRSGGRHRQGDMVSIPGLHFCRG